LGAGGDWCRGDRCPGCGGCVVGAQEDAPVAVRASAADAARLATPARLAAATTGLAAADGRTAGPVACGANTESDSADAAVPGPAGRAWCGKGCVMVKVRRFMGVIAAFGLACMGLVAGVAPALADSPITSQPYTSLLDIDQLHAQGLDGSGIKIALIDGPVDTSVPELQGVNVVKKAFCQVNYAPASIAHATAMASILASPAYGWAPKATILNYALPTIPDLPPGMTTAASAWPDCADNGSTQSMSYQIEQALNDGADVISISQGSDWADTTMVYALVRAALKGVPVVMAVGNNSNSSIDGTAAMNTVVAVGAVDGSGQRASYSNWGAGLTIMAYGGPMTARDPDQSGALSVVDMGTQGTSFATPMVAGALALAKQKWPNASGNQLERVMFDTIDGVADHQSAQPSPDMGFGVLNAPLAVATDPSGYSTDNVLAQKNSSGQPTPQDFTDYQDGTANPLLVYGDDEYVYRGCDESILSYGIPPGMKVEPSTAPECQNGNTPSTPGATSEVTPSASPVPVNTSSAGSVPWVLVGVGAAVIVALIVVVVLLTRRKTRRPPSAPPVSPMPPGWQPPPGWQQPPPGWQPPAAVPPSAQWPAAPSQAQPTPPYQAPPGQHFTS